MCTVTGGLISQWSDALEHSLHQCFERGAARGADGFGVAVYSAGGNYLFKTLTPVSEIQQNPDFNRVFDYLRRTPSRFVANNRAHALTEPLSVTVENIHPFRYGDWAVVHNGLI